MKFLAHHALSFDRHQKAVNGGLADRPAKSIDRIAILIQPLHDAVGALVNGRPEETSDTRVLEVLRGKGQRRVFAFAISKKARVEKLEPDQLLPLAHANAHGGLLQAVAEIDVG